jgi:hypothetical protein
MSPDQAPVETNGQPPDWLAVLDAYDVRFVILNSQLDDQLQRMVRADPQWTIDLVDGDTILFARARASTSARVPA